MGVKHIIKVPVGKDRVKTKLKEVSLTPVKAIRAFCMECVVWQETEVRECTALNCPLYPFRMGKNPGRAGIGGRK